MKAHMPFLVGVVLAVFVAVTGRLAGLDRDRAFYPVSKKWTVPSFSVAALEG